MLRAVNDALHDHLVHGPERFNRPSWLNALLNVPFGGAGKSAWGIELSEAVLKEECPDLLEKKVSRFRAESLCMSVCRDTR